jgi:outer membrane receptor protein involved in Fe transport
MPNPLLLSLSLSSALARHALTRFGAGCAAALWAVAGFAAQPSTSTTATPPVVEEEAVVLSPFTVSSTGDVGYQAGSTLAGSRLKTPLQDVAAQISVFTPELMSDLGLTNLDEIYLYSTNAESYLEYTPGGDSGTTSGSLQVDEGTRIRGLGEITVLRSFFETGFNIDTYNTERVTIASGPNALLFGLGNPGGITDASLKRANFLRNRTQLNYRRDNFDGRRFTFDTNVIVRPRQAALRIGALDANNRTFRDPNEDKNRRLYGTVTLQPFATTTVRLNGEWIHRDASRAAMVPPHDYVTPWLNAGRPAFDNSGINPNTAAATLNTRIAGAGLSRVFVRTAGNFVLPVGNSPALPLTNYANTASVVGANTLAPHLQDQTPEYSLLRPEIYDPRYNIYGPGNDSRARGRILNAFLEQKITKDFYLEAAYMRERNRAAQGSYVDGNNSMDIFVDANRFLPDGATANPNFGKAYSQSAMVGSLRRDDRSESRLTASYTLDFARQAGPVAWLGTHRLGGMLSNSDFTTVGQQYRMLMRGSPTFLPTAALSNLRNAARIPNFRTYLGNGVNYVSPVFPGSALDFTEPQFITGPNGERVEVAMYNNPDGSFGAANGTVRNVISRALVDQAYLLKDRLIVTYGWRESRVRLKGSLDAASTTPQANGLFPLLRNTHFADKWDTFDNGQSINWGVVGKPLSWLTVHYSDSSNFAVQEAPWFTPYGTPIPGSNGEGRDYGFSVHLPNNKFSVRVNRFTNNQNNTRPDNTISALRTIPMTIEQRILEVAPRTPMQGMDFNRYAQANYQVTGTQEAKGYDIEMTANPTPNWRGVLNAGRQRTTTQISNTWYQWVEDRLPVWQTYGAGWDRETYTAAGVQTIHQMYNQWVATQRDPLLAANGRSVANQREWRVSGIVTYAFTEGRWRGLTTGLGGRWRSPNTLGYGLTTLPGGQEVLDLNHAYKGSDELSVDTFASYTLRDLRLFRTKSKVKFQVNVRNLFARRGFIPTNVLTNGTPSVYTYRSPQQIIFSVDLDL